MSQNTKFEIWHSLLTEAMLDREISVPYSHALYQNCAACYGTGQTYHARTALGNIDLTDLFDKTIMLTKLKGIPNEYKENYQDY